MQDALSVLAEPLGNVDEVLPVGKVPEGFIHLEVGQCVVDRDVTLDGPLYGDLVKVRVHPGLGEPALNGALAEVEFAADLPLGQASLSQLEGGKHRLSCVNDSHDSVLDVEVVVDRLHHEALTDGCLPALDDDHAIDDGGVQVAVLGVVGLLYGQFLEVLGEVIPSLGLGLDNRNGTILND
jgi:hypothetical protein